MSGQLIEILVSDFKAYLKTEIKNYKSLRSGGTISGMRAKAEDYSSKFQAFDKLATTRANEILANFNEHIPDEAKTLKSRLEEERAVVMSSFKKENWD